MKSLVLKPGYKHLAIWLGTELGDGSAQDFEEFMLEKLGFRVQFIEEYHTKPTILNGEPVSGTGDRVDIFFAIHEEDAPMFTPMHSMLFGFYPLDVVLAMGCEGEANIYPEYLLDLCSEGVKLIDIKDGTLNSDETSMLENLEVGESCHLGFCEVKRTA